ncbi:CaiB/BaiF CoA transferase family protein [Steroidobacter sp.]|uniref:CaiB/BaiF CoA transferase family protein n=1 Tax=Steroidobacter sp. TaxID=1978227 RepID=UPI001A3B9D01|nr:CaiB/BaiF CoA-transferase family protein [Steroidobacter sp.]MBL8271644.1 CoA transferase [Steroidobacter sp.]
MTTSTGPLQGVRILEFAGLGPAPFCCMLLSDLGAQVIRIARPTASTSGFDAILDRGRVTLTLDLKQSTGIEICRSLSKNADALIEGFRPGVMEKLGLGPDTLLADNPKLVYGRMTGWGQHGPYSHTAGHDINYIALSGALHAIGSSNKPVAPLNLVGDFGGGALYLAMGVLAALLNVRTTGQGQVVDAAMTDGTASLMSMMFGMFGTGAWRDQRRANLLDGGAPFYDTYRCADDKWICIGALEPQFFAELLRRLEISASEFPDNQNRASWPAMRERFEQIFLSKPQSHWCQVLEHSDACFAPVLSMSEAIHHPHNVARGTFTNHGGTIQPAPAPRFSRTPSTIQERTRVDAATLSEWGLPEHLIEQVISP